MYFIKCEKNTVIFVIHLSYTVCVRTSLRSIRFKLPKGLAISSMFVLQMAKPILWRQSLRLEKLWILFNPRAAMNTKPY